MSDKDQKDKTGKSTKDDAAKSTDTDDRLAAELVDGAGDPTPPKATPKATPKDKAKDAPETEEPGPSELYEAAAVGPETDSADSDGLKPDATGSGDQTDPDQTDPDQTPPRGASADNSGGNSGVLAFMWGILILAALVGGAWATQPLWMPHVAQHLPMAAPDPTVNPRLDGLEDKVAALQSELQKVQAAPSGEDALADLQARKAVIQEDLSVIVDRVSAIEARLNEVRKMAAATTLPDQAANANAEISGLSDRLQSLGKDVEALDDVMQRIAKLEAEGRNLRTEAQLDGRDIAEVVRDLEGRVGAVEQKGDQRVTNQAMVLVIGQLREALDTRDPFTAELMSLKSLAPDEPAIAQSIAALETHADNGVATLEDLVQDFRDSSLAIVNAGHARPGDGWVSSTINQLSSLITIRSTDPNQTSGVNQTVAQAETLLAGGDLPGAVKALDGLDGAAAEAASSWLAKAKARVAAEKALATLHVHAVARLAPGQSPSAEPVSPQSSQPAE